VHVGEHGLFKWPLRVALRPQYGSGPEGSWKDRISGSGTEASGFRGLVALSPGTARCIWGLHGLPKWPLRVALRPQ